MPAPHRGFTNPPAGAPADRWRVALTRQDLRWMTTEEITEAHRAGAVQTETFVFRVGMPNWVTLLEVPEIAAALGRGAKERPAIANGTAPAGPPPRKAPSSRPPPRKAPRSAAESALHPGAEETEGPDVMPFALVSERASSGRRDTPSASGPQGGPSGGLRGEAAPGDGAPNAQSAPLPSEFTPNVHLNPNTALPSPLEGSASDAQVPAFSQSLLAARRSSSSRIWLWVIVALAVLLATAVWLGPRFGLVLL